MTFSSIRRSRYSRLISLCLMVTFVTTMIITPGVSYAQDGVMGLPKPGTMVNLSPAYVPMMLTGLSVHPENPLLMDFIVSTGNSGLNAPQVKKESGRLIKYFLACLTIPENNQWVNLSPYEKDRIIPKDLGQTVLGRDMLEEDYLLKQLTASLIYPEKNLGKDFWDKVYAQANQMYGTTQIPVNTFNKVWILPDTAKVYEHKDTVFVVQSHLKVMLDEDYLALSKHNSSVILTLNEVKGKDLKTPLDSSASPQNDVNHLGNQIVREIILPAIEKEVNTGKNFAQLRQIYNSMILAVWFKKNLKQALLNQVYADKSKVNGVNVNDPAIKEKIYKQYLQAYKKGVFNYIKEESFPPLDGEGKGGVMIPRKYFSGGLTPVTKVKLATLAEAEKAFSSMPGENKYFRVFGGIRRTNGNPVNNRDRAMIGRPGQDLENILSGKLLSVKAKIQPLLDAYYTAKARGEVDEVKRLDGEINKIVDELNVYNQSKPEELMLSDDVESLSTFLSNPNAGVYQGVAKLDYLDGNYVPQFIFAGAATRLNRGPMYNLDIWDIAIELGKAKPEDAKYRMGMGPRQIMAYRLALEEMAKQNGESPAQVLARQKMIINVNADIEQTVLDDFINNGFYGFNPENVYFIVQPTYHGYKFQNGSLEFAPQSPTVPYGHGHNFMQLGENGQAFTLATDGSRNYLQGSILDQFSDSMFIGSHRINDLTKLSKDSVISVDKLAFAIAKFGQGFDVVAELVDNPNKQKGGNVLKDTRTGKSFLIETSNVKGAPGLVRLLDEAGKVGAPYNAFRLVYMVGNLKRILKKSLPFNLRFKDGDFYLEAVTGDVTQMMETNAKFMSSGEQIHDFKEPKNIADALNYLRQSDDQLASAGVNNAMTTAVLPVNKVALKKGAEILRSIQTNIERGYDVRGIAIGPKATMTPDTLYATGVALGLELNSRAQGHRPKVLVTGDQRSTTPALRQAVSAGLAPQGIDVDFTNELVSTPAANVIPRLPGSGYDAEVQITASHNPWTKYIASEGNKLHDPENGFKINIRQPDGQFRGIFGQGMWNILQRSLSPEAEESNPKPGEIKEVKVMDRYYDHLAQLIKKNLIALGLTLEQAQKELVLVVDTGNALMGPVAKAVIQGRLGIQYVGVDDEVISSVEGIPVHEADPSKRPVYAQHLTGEVQKVAQRPENQGKIVIGLAFDGDGDRIGMTDENGSQYLTPNQQGYFFFSRIKETNPHSVFVLDIRMGQEIMEELNLKPENAKWHAPGWAIVRKAMQETGADVAVEGSHHTMLRQFEDPNTDAIDDGLYAGLFAAIQALKLKTEGRSIHQLLDRSWYPSLVEELRPAVTEFTPGERYELMPKIAKNLTQEVESVYQGARILSILSPGERGAVRLQISDSNGSFRGWILIRASNTSPRLSMQAQGRDKPTIKQLAKILSGVLSQFDKVNQADVQNVLAKTLSDTAQLSIYAQDDEMSLNRRPQRLSNQRKDNAMNSPGGIDINARNLNMESYGQKVNITFDPAMIAQFKRGDFSGVKIQILNVVPIDLMPLLGLKENEESGQLVKV